VGEVSEMFALFSRRLPESPAAGNSRIVSRPVPTRAGRWKEVRPRTMNFALFAACLLFQAKAHGEIKEVRRVAIFYERCPSSPAVALLDRGIRGALDTSDYQIELCGDDVETTLFDDPAAQQALLEWYIHRYQDRRPDLIIALGPTSLRFMIDSHEKFFTEVSIIFGDTSDPQADNPKLDSNFTGCWEMFEPNKTLDVALRIQPGSRHIVVVGGTSAFDRHLVVSAANAPVFGPSIVAVGHGEVRGYLESFARQGRIVRGIVLRVLNGERPQDVSIVHGANAYIFHERALKRWGFRESDLPPGSEVLFRVPSFWERTEWKWVAAPLIILCLIVFALYVRLKLARDRALGLSGMLITAQEKERGRLASEIHDDFSQRMALLALGLENAKDAIEASPDEAVRQVHALLRSASEIGADLHTLSHRLHSSTLEKLGLVPGVSALCKEFALQHAIEVDFLANDIPRSIPPDVSLCVFRIVQEGLRNLMKHSGAAKAQVHLRMAAQRIVVTIRDEGIGFDVGELGNKEGLGIRSMEERAYLLGGRFKVYSELGKGTEIVASVPLQPRLGKAAG
jgi:signal transduction histidine kinase